MSFKEILSASTKAVSEATWVTLTRVKSVFSAERARCGHKTTEVLWISFVGKKGNVRGLKRQLPHESNDEMLHSLFLNRNFFEITENKTKDLHRPRSTASCSAALPASRSSWKSLKLWNHTIRNRKDNKKSSHHFKDKETEGQRGSMTLLRICDIQC